MQSNVKSVKEALLQRGVSRRDFLKFCGLMAGVLAMPQSVQAQIAAALQTKKRTPVIWLELSDCAGCSESFLRASRPSAAEIVLDVLSVDYHETIMAAAGKQAEEAKQATIEAGGYLLVVEGAIPTGDSAYYCCIGGRTAEDLLMEAAAGAVAVVAVGNCATFGGLPRAAPNPTNAVGVFDLVKDKPVLNLSGCPYNVVNLTATVVHFLTFGKLPDTDALGRPLFAYGHLIHDNCERRGQFDAGQFVQAWGDEGHRAGWCLYKMGCKGPIASHNCPAVRWNEGTNWPVGSGHGCIACSEPNFWENPFYVPVKLEQFTPPSAFPPIEVPVTPVPTANAVATGAFVGLAAGVAGAVAVNHLRKRNAHAAEEETEEVEEEKKG